ncbi:ankyrin repeat domain-containing protein 12 [Culicoides brevitarsis]|uniref:ankyrin repeat domain-containing protein 12 n=1 Tax=Culicoides brevitarsis TaxID=469753 RepID=UPI00307B56D4
MQNGSPFREAVPSTSGYNFDRTPLHEAAIAGDEETLQLLLRTGADRNAKDSQHGNTPLHEAAWRGYSRCVNLLCVLPKQKAHKILLDLKAQKAIQETKGVLHSALLSTRNYGGFSALHLAAQNGHNQSCREILLAGADPNVQNNYGDTPLHTACRYGHAGAVRILLSAKCDPQRVNLNGDTPLHIACAMGRRKLTRILLEGGCDKSIINAQGESARDIAVRKKLKELVSIIDKTSINLSPENKNHSRDRSSSSSRNIKSSTKNGTKDKSKRKSHDQVDHHGKKLPDPRHWSPYGCHYSPDPKCFPSPKLETLPKDPLNKGEQYYLDLAGNIRKGPVGVGTSCYCAPFFRHLEHRLSKNKNNLKKYVKKVDNKIDALAIKTDDQIGELTKSIISDRIRCEDKKLYLKEWLKRGILHRASLAPGKVTAKEYESATNTLTRSKSLEVLDNDEILFKGDIKTSTPAGLSRSVDLLNHHSVTVHRDAEYSDNPADSSVNSNCKNHPESDRERSSLINSSDKDRTGSFKKESSTEKSLSQPSEGKKVGKFRISKEPKSSRYKIREARAAVDDSFERDSLSNAESNDFDEDYRASLVTKRLEKLLYETKSMLEKEKLFQKLRKHDEALFSPDNYLMKAGSGRMFNRDQLIEHIEATRLRDFDDRTRNIEKEMEMITRTLGGQSIMKDHSSPIKSRSRRESVMSPEPLENDVHEYNTSDENEEYVDDIPDTEQNDTRYLTSTNFNESGNQSQSSDDDEDGIDSQVAVNDLDQPMSNGFFTNSNFNDSHNRSSSSEQQSPATVRETPDICRNVNGKPTTELSDASNVKELNELKSRILTGTNWRSKVLKVSADEARASSSSGSPEFATNVEQNNIYDVRSSEVVKTSKTIRDPIQEIDSDVVDAPAVVVQEQPPALPAKGIVKRLISKIQKSSSPATNSTETSNVNPIPRTNVSEIPKDAYFHELPPKKPLPIAVARNRNPLPIDLNENDILQEQNNLYASHQAFYANTPSSYQTQHYATNRNEQFPSPTNDSGYNSTRLYDNSGASEKYSIIHQNSQYAGYHQASQGDANNSTTPNGNNNLSSKEFYLPNGSSLV